MRNEEVPRSQKNDAGLPVSRSRTTVCRIGKMMKAVQYLVVDAHHRTHFENDSLHLVAVGFVHLCAFRVPVPRRRPKLLMVLVLHFHSAHTHPGERIISASAPDISSIYSVYVHN